LRRIFRFVIVDTTPGLGEHALTALDLATDAVFSSSLSVSSLRAMRTELAVLSGISTGSAVHHMVLNFGDKMSGLTTRDAALTMGVPVDIVIPRSLAVPLSTNRGIPLLQSKSSDPAAKALGELVTRIASKTRVRWRLRNRKKAAA
jgi:septum formation inhibitor-activating ATPase MinD